MRTFWDGPVIYKYDLNKQLPDIEIHFDDGVFVNKDQQMDEDLKNVVAGVLSKTTFLERNYGLSEDDAKKELARIQAEQRTLTQLVDSKTRNWAVVMVIDYEKNMSSKADSIVDLYSELQQQIIFRIINLIGASKADKVDSSNVLLWQAEQLKRLVC